MEKMFSFHHHFKEMETKNNVVVDVPSLFLVEATGDSEVDSNPNRANIYTADDDAESCSYDASDYSCVSDFNECEDDDVVDHHHGSCKEQEEESHAYDQSWTGQGVKFPKNQKSCVSVESTNESMNEMEKNKLFWEACLAS